MSSLHAIPTTNEMILRSVTGAPEQPFHSFLSLAPVQSASYPVQPTTGAAFPDVAKATAPDSGVPTPPRGLVLLAEEVTRVEKSRRSSSVSSEGISPRRFLKLGPVFGGGEPGVGDYADE
ncbi:MAG: hypothetical protein M1839_008204 [Geoglossum umbratile]|nr:MAG: hypothetical protein M1839_008204 [Geoglossum umbratile]